MGARITIILSFLSVIQGTALRFLLFSGGGEVREKNNISVIQKGWWILV